MQFDKKKYINNASGGGKWRRVRGKRDGRWERSIIDAIQDIPSTRFGYSLSHLHNQTIKPIHFPLFNFLLYTLMAKNILLYTCLI